jgi:hypothetical protein
MRAAVRGNKPIVTEWLHLMFLGHRHVLVNEKISECVVLVASALCEGANVSTVIYPSSYVCVCMCVCVCVCVVPVASALCEGASVSVLSCIGVCFYLSGMISQHVLCLWPRCAAQA